MKPCIAVLSAVIAMLLTATIALAQDVYVQGYFKSDGTYVQPHYRSAPNSNTLDNWSTRGNVNPYTGQRGTRDPYGSSNPYRTYNTNPYSDNQLPGLSPYRTYNTNPYGSNQLDGVNKPQSQTWGYQ